MFGQQFVVENRVGAMGTLAADAVARSQPDGYTLFWAGTGTISIFPAMGKPPYDTAKDFAPISVIGTSPQVLIVNPKLPIKTVQEFVAYVKAQPEKLALCRRRRTGQRQQSSDGAVPQARRPRDDRVSYRGTAPALTDIIGGHIPAMFMPLPEALPQAEAARSACSRSPTTTARAAHRKMPTIAESGYPGFRGVSWNGLMAPAGTPKAIIDRIAAEFAKAAKDPKFIAQLDTYGVEPLGLTPEEFAQVHSARTWRFGPKR